MVRSSSQRMVILALSMTFGACIQEGPADRRNEELGLVGSSSELGNGLGSATVYFPSDLQGLSGSLAIGEGGALANPLVAGTLSVGSDLASAGPSVSVQGSVEMSANDFGRLQIEIPFEGGASLVGGRFLVVVYSVVGEDGKTRVGIIPPTGYTIRGNKIRFVMRGYGNYQAAYASQEVREEIVAAGDNSATTKSKKQQLALPAMMVTQIIHPPVPKPGANFTIQGSNLREGLRMNFVSGEGPAFRSIPFSNITVASADNTATAEMPAVGVGRSGVGRIYLNQDGSEYKADFLYEGEKGPFPVATLDAAKVCAGEKFYNQQGVLVEGTAPCGPSTGESAIASVSMESVPPSQESDQQMLCSGTTQAECQVQGTACKWESNTCELDPWNLRVGVTLGGKTGMLKVNCLTNASNLTGTADYVACHHSNWADLTPAPGCTTAQQNCSFQDLISGLIVSEVSTASMDFSDFSTPTAANYCAALAPASTWRLPSQKEAMQLSLRGISSLATRFGVLSGLSETIWTSDKQGSDVWTVNLATGVSQTSYYFSSKRVLCVK